MIYLTKIEAAAAVASTAVATSAILVPAKTGRECVVWCAVDGGGAGGDGNGVCSCDTVEQKQHSQRRKNWIYQRLDIDTRVIETERERENHSKNDYVERISN